MAVASPLFWLMHLRLSGKMNNDPRVHVIVFVSEWHMDNKTTISLFRSLRSIDLAKTPTREFIRRTWNACDLKRKEVRFSARSGPRFGEHSKSATRIAQ